MDSVNENLRKIMRDHILFAAMPKSASQTLNAMLCESILNSVTIDVRSGLGIGNFTINRQLLESEISKLERKSIPILYQHFFPTYHNRCLVEEYFLNKFLGKMAFYTRNKKKPKVIVTVRNIFDVMMSARDHQKRSHGPLAVFKEERKWFLSPDVHSDIWNGIMCIKFYASWIAAHQNKNWEVKLVTYDEIVDRGALTVSEICRFCGIREKDVVITERVNDIHQNFSTGEKGRGVGINPFHREVIEQFAGSFTGIDFSPLGL
jgi:hypothetical protein